MRASVWLLSSFVLSAGCGPTTMLADSGLTDASTDRTMTVDAARSLDATTDAPIAMPDVAPPTGCTGVCAASLVSCGQPEATATEQCAARCAAAGMTARDAVECIQRTPCVDVVAAFSRGVEVCGLQPTRDAGTLDVIARPDVVADVPRMDVAADAPRLDVAADAPRADVVADVPRTDAVADVPRADAAVDAPRVDATADVPRVDAAADVPRSG